MWVYRLIAKLWNYLKANGDEFVRFLMYMTYPPHLIDVQKMNAYEDWYQKLTPVEGADYEELLKLAQLQYEEQLESFNSLDKKSEWLIGIDMAFAALLFSAITEKAKTMPILPYLPIFALLLLSMHCSVRARSPISRHKPMGAKSMFDLLKIEKENFKARIAASYFNATEGLNGANDWKAAHIKFSARLFMLSIAGAVFIFAFPEIMKFIARFD